MHWIFSLYVAFLFFILTPAILVRLPPKAGKFTVAGFHAVVFALILHFTGKMVWNFSRGLEGFQEGISDKPVLPSGGYSGTSASQSYPFNTKAQAYAKDFCLNTNAGLGGKYNGNNGKNNCTDLSNNNYSNTFLYDYALSKKYTNSTITNVSDLSGIYTCNSLTC